MLNEYAVSCLYCCFKVALQLTVVVVVGGGVDTDTAAAAAAVVVWFFILSGVSLSVLPTLLMIDVKPLCFLSSISMWCVGLKNKVLLDRN
jgi:hypothetical protein